MNFDILCSVGDGPLTSSWSLLHYNLYSYTADKRVKLKGSHSDPTYHISDFISFSVIPLARQVLKRSQRTTVVKLETEH